MNKLKLSKLTSHEKAFKLIHYAELILQISYIYQRCNLLRPYDTSKVEKDYKRLKSVLTRANRLRGCITKDDIATNALSFAEHLDRLDATYNRGYTSLLFIELLYKGNSKRSMQLCLQRGLIVNQITSELKRVLIPDEINIFAREEQKYLSKHLVLSGYVYFHSKHNAIYNANGKINKFLTSLYLKKTK